MMHLPGESRFIAVDGIKTHYVVAGSGPPLLLFHGLGSSVVAWRDNIGPLSRSFRVHAIDLPGHGDSDKPNIPYLPEDVVHFVARFARALRLDRASIIGNSIGGALGIMLANSYPELVSSLILVNSAGLGKDISLYIRLASVPVLGSVLESAKVGSTMFMLKNVFHDSKFVTKDLVLELYRSRKMRGAKQAVVRVLRHTVSLGGVRKNYVLLDQLGKIKAPLMLVWGAQDHITPVAHAYNAAEAAPSAMLHVFDQCGHWPQMERAADFNSLVLQFLKK